MIVILLLIYHIYYKLYIFGIARIICTLIKYNHFFVFVYIIKQVSYIDNQSAKVLSVTYVSLSHCATQVCLLKHNVITLVIIERVCRRICKVATTNFFLIAVKGHVYFYLLRKFYLAIYT
jgi:hypothetical protein